MPEFAYVGLDTAGRERRGSVRAETSEAARDQLVSRRLYVVRIEPAAEHAAPLLSRGLFARRKIGAKQLTLVHPPARHPDHGHARSKRRCAPSRARPSATRCGACSATSMPASSRAAASPRRWRAKPASFPPLYRAMVAAGESSGTLPQILERLANLMERQAQVRGKVLSTLAYPIILAIVAAFVVFALMIFVVPKVVEQFQRHRPVAAAADPDRDRPLQFPRRLVVGAAAADRARRLPRRPRAQGRGDPDEVRPDAAAAAAGRPADPRSPRGADGADALDDGGEPAAFARGPQAHHRHRPQSGAARGLGRHRRNRSAPAAACRARCGAPASSRPCSSISPPRARPRASWT